MGGIGLTENPLRRTTKFSVIFKLDTGFGHLALGWIRDHEIRYLEVRNSTYDKTSCIQIK